MLDLDGFMNREDSSVRGMEVADHRGVLEYLYRRWSHPRQFLREFTENAIGAIRRAGGEGDIVWDYDRVSLGRLDAYKLSVVDNGVGMTASELVDHLTEPFPDGHPRAVQEARGTGAVVTAAASNPYGLHYVSWQGGEAAERRLSRDEDGRWAAREPAPGSTWSHAEDAAKPEVIGDHGTKVTLLGESPEDCTMEPPVEDVDPSSWIVEYLNRHYFRPPAGITIRAREGWNRPEDSSDHTLRTIRGQKGILDRHALEAGTVDLSEATAHWWLLPEKDARPSSSPGRVTGHFALLHENELYDVNTGAEASTILANCGVVGGYHRAVVYLEPDPDALDSVGPDALRQNLLIDHPKPWEKRGRGSDDEGPERLERWTDEFCERLPAPLQQLAESHKGERIPPERREFIRSRLEESPVDYTNTFK